MNSTLYLAPMHAEKRASCDRCLEWTTSVDSVLKVLSDDSSACEGCGYQGTMRTISDQYHKRRPRWWIVGTTVVVPMWIVEHLRRRKPVR